MGALTGGHIYVFSRGPQTPIAELLATNLLLGGDSAVNYLKVFFFSDMITYVDI